MIEQIIMKQTLKAGDNIWEEGKIINSPLPKILLDEIKAGTGTIEVLDEGRKNDSGKLVFVTQRVDEPMITATSQTQVETGAVALSKPEAQLKQAQKPRHKPKPKTVLKRRKK